jgi:hypothetical protein
VVTKLHFVHYVIHAWRTAAVSPQPDAESAPPDPLLPERAVAT